MTSSTDSPHAVPNRVARASWAAAAGSVLFAGSGVALADGLEEVVVTAQKRQQSAQDVGVSLSALSQEELRLEGIDGPLSLATAVPGVQMNSASGGNFGAQLTIRGISQSDYSPHQESPNSMYIDDVYISAPNWQAARVFDVQRVEVLRGPQGTLFGRNSTGGLVNWITAKPSKELSGYFDLTGGAFGEVAAEGAIGGPLSDTVRGRVSFSMQNNDGYVKNHHPGVGDLNNTRFWAVRGQLAADLTDHLTGLLSVSFTSDDDREGFYGHISSWIPPVPGGRPAPLPANINAYGTGPGNDFQGYSSPYSGNEGDIGFLGFLRRTILSPTLRFDWDLGGATLTSITNVSKMVFRYDENCGGDPGNTCRDPFTQDLSQWSQELRINGAADALTWVTGVYGLGAHSLSTGAFFSPYYAGTPFAFNAFNDIDQNTHSYALFGQTEYLFSPHWRGTLGLRVTRDSKSFSSQTYLNEAGDLVSTDTVYKPPLLVYDFSAATVGGLAYEEKTDWSGKIQLDYVIDKASMLYASISRGIKSAGFNANAGATTSIAATPFKGEQVTVYELGEKLTMLDNKLRVNGAAFYYDYASFQGYQLTTLGITPVVTNNKAKFNGAEVEVTANPVHGLDTRVGLTYIDSTVYNVRTAQIGVVNQSASDAPPWSANWMARYTWALGSGTMSLQYSADYIGQKYHSIDNTPAVRVPASTGHNARVNYAWNRWELTGFVDNFTNAIRPTSAYDQTTGYGYAIRTFAKPRWWGVTLHYAL